MPRTARERRSGRGEGAELLSAVKARDPAIRTAEASVPAVI